MATTFKAPSAEFMHRKRLDDADVLPTRAKVSVLRTLDTRERRQTAIQIDLLRLNQDHAIDGGMFFLASHLETHTRPRAD